MDLNKLKILKDIVKDQIEDIKERNENNNDGNKEKVQKINCDMISSLKEQTKEVVIHKEKKQKEEKDNVQALTQEVKIQVSLSNLLSSHQKRHFV